jgi:CRISPR-associated endonuclease/helicase Cas3
MAHLLRVASDRDLRRIFVVLPYTNIIKQAVETYRKALVLPGENAEEVVAEHHHQADFKDVDLRGMSELWVAPIVVTTAVQFFETLGNHLPARLRKLHQVSHSAIFIDEAHAAIPAWLWPQQWLWLQELVDSWGCHMVLASGSLVRFWEDAEFLKGQAPRDVHRIIDPELSAELASQEKRRVSLPLRSSPKDRHELVEFVLSKPGPRLVILNTVQSAAVIAHEMRRKGCDVLHLSTALAPVDRDPIVKTIKDRLALGAPDDWTLVATSCVEAGMDFDFRTAFRESASVCSLLQTAGRVNRHGRGWDSEVLDFRTNDTILNQHPAFERARYVLDQMYEEGLLARLPPEDAATEAFRRELETGVAIAKAADLLKAENDMDYPEVGALNRVIDADTRLVLVDTVIVEAIKNHQVPTSRDLVRNSVQLWSKKVEALGLEVVDEGREIYHFGSHKYDPKFLGYMEGFLPLIYATEEGLIV